MKAIQFSNLTLECATRTLRNQSGNKIILRPLPYEVLLLLLQRDEPVSREELFAHCWQGMVVTDQALTNVISGLRRNFLSLKAVGAEITTISKVGYFINADSIEIEWLAQSQATKSDIAKPVAVVEEKPKRAPRFSWKCKSIQSCSLLCLFTVVMGLTVFALVALEPFVEKPSYVKMKNYQRFSNGDTDYYVHDEGGDFVRIGELKQALAPLVPSTCGVDVYIRFYPSLYRSNTVAMTVWLQQQQGKRNHMYRYFDVEPTHIASNVVRSLNNPEVKCD
ncbi:winged helix-turn-helix domain-containing protein [Vibrio sinaloensis]|uniref:winged helix-turn-helix domain-containing protein n=1 Tax=Photobacterium sp. (strain ATCC 43367) TaxID=379097 RepID=UPI00031F97FC|nr:winged helix-turn-helix domain-containing protein [Vibrio sinaloensis]